MRMWWLAVVALGAQPVAAKGPFGTPPAHYYGPMQGFFAAGFKHRIEKDGSWRIVADSRAIDGDGFALNVAMYRAAELARDQGYEYIQLLGGYGTRERRFRNESATLYARPSHDAAAPASCRSRDASSCYTASVARLLTLLSGASGSEPGVAKPSYVDQFGRTVTVTGFGIGAAAGPGAIDPASVVARRIPPMALAAPVAMAPVMPAIRVQPRTASPADTVLEARLRAARPIQGGDPVQGWTITD